MKTSYDKPVETDHTISNAQPAGLAICRRDPFLYLALTLSLMVTGGAAGGIFLHDTYLRETAGWRSQAQGQDIIDLLLIVPLLITGSIMNFMEKRSGYFYMGSALMFLIYTYFIFCFSVHFNAFFLLYCAILGLSGYLLLRLLTLVNGKTVKSWFQKKLPANQFSIFLNLFAAFFLLLWLKDIIPAIWHDTIPGSITGTGLFTNPVEVLDLCFLLPGMMFAARLLRQETGTGYQLVPMLLLFSFAMAANIALLLALSYHKGTPTSLLVIVVMAVVSLGCLFLSWRFLKYLA